jgi:hypothetical protein
MQMELLQAQVPYPKITTYYKKTAFEFDIKDVHPVDQMDMQQTNMRDDIFNSEKYLNDYFQIAGIPE